MDRNFIYTKLDTKMNELGLENNPLLQAIDVCFVTLLIYRSARIDDSYSL